MAPVREMTRVRSVAGVLAVCALLSTGCSSSGEHVVFTVATGFSSSATARTTDLVDIGLDPLHNLSDQKVALRRVSLVSAPRSVHIRMVTGYLRSQIQIWTIGYALGNFVKHCRRQMTPYRLPSIVTPPHSDSRWFLVLSLTFSKPGRYYLGRVRIDYTVNGQQGWQYQNLHQTMTITLHNKKLPAFSGCL
jgi:hypothetical protein